MPLVHRNYEQSGLGKKAYHKFLAGSRAILFIARALSGVVGALLYIIQPWLPFFGWLMAIVCNIVIGWLLVEKRDITENISYRLHISSAIKAMAHSKIIIALLISYIAINLVGEAIWTGYQVLYKQDGQAAMVYGTLFSVIAVFSAISAYLVRKLYSRFNPMSILFFGSVLVAVTAWTLYQPNVTVRLFAIIPMAIASGFMSVTVNAVIQHQIKNSLQSTALSVYSVIVYVVYCLGSLWVGWTFDTGGADLARLWLLIGAIIACVITAVLSLSIARRTGFRLEDESDSNEVGGFAA